MRLHRQGEKVEHLLKEKLFPVCPHFVSQIYRVHSSIVRLSHLVRQRFGGEILRERL